MYTPSPEYKLKQAKLAKLRWRVALIIVVFLVPFICYQNWQSYKIDRDGVYIKCIVTKIQQQKKGSKLVSFVYLLNGKQYTSEAYADLETSDIGKQFFLKALPRHPQKHFFFERRPVPDCLLQTPAPRGGWKTLPVCKD